MSARDARSQGAGIPPRVGTARTVSQSRAAWLAVAVALLTAACGGSTPSSPTPSSLIGGPSLVSVTVVPPSLLPGETGSASAVGWSTRNNSSIYGPLPVSRWTSSDTRVATIDSAGRVTAIGSGTARITATIDGGTVVGQVVVFTESEVEGLDISCPTPVTLPIGVFCQAYGRSRTASRLEVRVTWSSSNTEVATIGNASEPSHAVAVVGRAAGETVVTGTLRGLSARATVVFLPPRN